MAKNYDEKNHFYSFIILVLIFILVQGGSILFASSPLERLKKIFTGPRASMVSLRFASSLLASHQKTHPLYFGLNALFDHIP